MNRKSRTRTRADWLINQIKPILTAAIVLAFLQFTGLISALSSATQWTLLQTGLRDADTETEVVRTDFDYDFTIKDLQGNRIPVETFKGKVIFLNLWATWCGPCRAEMPGIQSLYEKVDKEKVVFIMLSIDRDDDLNRVSKYIRDKAFTFVAYMPSGFLPDQLKVPSIPTTFIISPDGKVVKKEIGAQQYDTPEFEKLLEKLAE